MRSGSTVCTARNAAERLVQCSELNRETVHRHSKSIELRTNAIILGKPDEDFSLTIAKRGEEGVPVAEFFDVEEPELESWNFTWYVE